MVKIIIYLNKKDYNKLIILGVLLIFGIGLICFIIGYYMGSGNIISQLNTYIDLNSREYCLKTCEKYILNIGEWYIWKIKIRYI